MLETVNDKGVSSGARLIFGILKDRARGKNWPECWPMLWSIAEDSRKSRRSVIYYLKELERAGAIEVIRSAGNGNRYRMLLEVNERIGDLLSVAPVQPIAPLPVQPIAPLPVQPIALVGDLLPYMEKQQAASSAGTEVPAAAAESKTFGEEMKTTEENLFEGFVKLGMPPSAEMAGIIKESPDLAAKVLRHCKTRFSGHGKPVQSHGGYIVACLREPYKFGFMKSGGKVKGPDDASCDAVAACQASNAFNKAETVALLARGQAAAEKAYVDMRDTWDKLPEAARQEIRDFVAGNSPLFHASCHDEQEFQFQCITEAFTIGRTKWRQKHLGS